MSDQVESVDCGYVTTGVCGDRIRGLVDTDFPIFFRTGGDFWAFSLSLGCGKLPWPPPLVTLRSFTEGATG